MGKTTPFTTNLMGLKAWVMSSLPMKVIVAVGCGAFKFFEVGTVELKRMYTPPIGRKKGTATLVLKELEAWAKELGNKRCVLETGKNLPEAVALYSKSGYRRIPNYEPYLTTDNSICFQKTLN